MRVHHVVSSGREDSTKTDGLASMDWAFAVDALLLKASSATVRGGMYARSWIN